MKYSESFKSKMVEKLLSPAGPSARALSREVDVCQQTLSRWQREAVKVSSMTDKNKYASSKGPRGLQVKTAEEKLQVIIETAPLCEEGLGAFLRRRGLHRSDLERWRGQILAGLAEPARASQKNAQESRRIRELERDLRRKDKALAEASALLVLKKKVQAIWGAEDDDTVRWNGK
jgi:transposase